MFKNDGIKFIQYDYVRAGLGNNLLRFIDLLTIYNDKKKFKVFTNHQKITRFCKPQIIGSRGFKNRQKLLLSETLYRKDKIDLNLHFNVVSKKEIDKNILGIHFRGTDFERWKKHSIIPPSFFIKATKKFNYYKKIYLVTDDINHINVKELLNSEFFRRKSIFCFSNSEYSDFSILSRTHRIIASPSTFSLCASIFGPKNIIYPKIYAELEIKSPFWRCLLEGKSTNHTRVKLI